MSKLAIGIDLGGTNARCSLIADDRTIIASNRTATPVSEGFEGVMKTLAALVEKTITNSGHKDEDILGISAATPGPIDSNSGVVLEAPNLKWRNVPAAARLTELTGIKTYLENDANAAGYGEYWAGAGKGCNTMLMFTLGTGVGGAVIIDGKLRKGPDGTAGEIGHVTVQDGGRQCGCGMRGCLEAYSSATATISRFKEGLKIGWASSLNNIDPETITCKDIFQAAKEGDELARHTVQGTARYLAIMIGSMANLLNPDRCVFSGGMIQAGNYLFDMIKEELKPRLFRAPIERLEILPATLGEDAGVIGAAGLLFASHK